MRQSSCADSSERGTTASSNTPGSSIAPSLISSVACPPLSVAANRIAALRRPGRPPPTRASAAAAIERPSSRAAARYCAGASIAPCHEIATALAMPCGSSCASSLRSAAPSGRRCAVRARTPRSIRSASNLPPVGTPSAPCVQRASTAPGDHRTPLPATSVTPRSDTLVAPASRVPLTRPCSVSISIGKRSGARRAETSRSARSAVTPRSTPAFKSNQVRALPAPRSSSNGRSMACVTRLASMRGASR